MMSYLHHFSEKFFGFNVFFYVTFRAVAAAVTAFLISLIFGNFVIRILTALKLGQPIRGAAEVHRLAELHGGKLFQIILAVIITAVFLSSPLLEVQARSLYVPFVKAPVIDNMGWFAVVFFALVIVGASNAVNLTDGLDGLAIGCTVTVAIAYAVLSYVAGNFRVAEYLQVPFYPFTAELAVVCSALIGAGFGFLWYNCHPAQVFMGDTGSLAIGGLIGVVAICCKQELLLVVVGGVFVLEAVSVILQVLSFKLTGRRIFAMSPIHHHFELMGWKENTVIVRFWILSGIFALIGLATLKLR